MKTHTLLLYTILLMVGMTCGIIALIDVFSSQTIWSKVIGHNYIVDILIFISGAVTAITSMNKIDKRYN
jgi:hypothetical protein